MKEPAIIMTKKNNLLQELEKIKDLKEDWDNYGADPIDKKVITNVEFLINNLKIKPVNIAPTPWGTIQMYWRSKNTDITIEVLEPERDGREFISYLEIFIIVTNNEQETNIISKQFKLSNYSIIDNFVEFFICN
jgi:hypothetical protein